MGDEIKGHWRCQKCRSVFPTRDLIRKQATACPYCDEPSLELYDISGLVADWSSGEFGKKPEPEGVA